MLHMTSSDSLQNQSLEHRLLQQYNEIAQLAGALAHEIKNPLSVIRMNIDLLAEDFEEEQTPRARRALNKIQILQRQCQRLQTLLNDFLKFARLNQLELTAGSLNEQVGRVLELFAPQAHEAGIEIVHYLDPDLPAVLLDEQTMEAALVNLVKNALEAMPGGGQLTVRTRITRHGVALDLIDTGIGMDENTAMHMFDAFFSTKDGGSGLGLPTARKVIEAHGGRIDVQSELGRGTKFTLEFPVPARLESQVASDVHAT
jgi:signal transduction histidine kinase